MQMQFIVGFAVVVAMVLIAAGLFLTPKDSAKSPAQAIVASIGKSDFRRHAERIAEIRGAGSVDDGVHLLREPVKIGADDYLLMGCDNSSARRNFPEVPRAEREEGRWFAGAPDLPQEAAGGNYHASERRGGGWEIEAFYTSLPQRQYQAVPEEVAWHYVRLKELRAQGMPVEQRIATMNAEAKSKPWEQMK